MKILLVNDYSTLFGGAEIALINLRDGLRKRGQEVRFFSSSAQVRAGERLADYECFGTTSRFSTLLQTFNPFAFCGLRRALDEFKPDIVHVGVFLTQLSPSILPLLKDVPSLLHIHWYRPICPIGTKMLPDKTLCQASAGTVCYTNHCLPLRDWLPLELQMKLFRHWRRVFGLFVANSEAVRQRLIAEGIQPVQVIGYGTPVQPPRPSLSLPPTVGFSGRLVREKGVDVLLRAFANVIQDIPQAQLRIAGEGREESYLKKLILDLRLSSSVSFRGFLTRPEQERFFAPVWVQAIPSLWEEPFGMVTIEAMMRGTAVVASDTGGLAGIVQDGRTGFLVPPGDPDSLSSALTRLLQNRDLAEQMGKAGCAVALTQFSESIYADRFIQLYQSLCKN